MPFLSCTKYMGVDAATIIRDENAEIFECVCELYFYVAGTGVQKCPMRVMRVYGVVFYRRPVSAKIKTISTIKPRPPLG
jgi:hypothetical protein